MNSSSVARPGARDAKSSGQGSGLDLDALEKAVARIQWSRTRRMIDKLRRGEACDGTADTAADELERLADAFEFTATPLIETQRELLAGLVQSEWRPIRTAPRDGSRFWGLVGDDAIAMFWHPEFGGFVSRFRRMTMAEGYTVDGKAFRDHSPTYHEPTHWMPLPPQPRDQQVPGESYREEPQ